MGVVGTRDVCQKRNLFSPRFHRFWRTILKFNDSPAPSSHAGEIGDIALA